MREARDWVRFHRELCKGTKRGIPRALRFVYMEVSLEARRKRGHVVLTPAMSDVDALHDLLGGDRKEIVKAHDAFTGGTDPMWRFETVGEERQLHVHEWTKWNPIDPTASERQQRKRNADRDNDRYEVVIDGGTESRLSNDESNGYVTSSGVDVTGPSARGRVSLLSLSHDSSLSPKQRDNPEAGSTGPATEGERHVRLTDTLTPELKSAAEMATVQDIAGAWAKFTGHYADKWVHVAGKWQSWCVNEAKRERVDRERERDRAQRGAQGASGTPNVNQYDGPAIRAERARRNASYEESRRTASPAPVADLMAAIGERAAQRSPPAEERPSETRQKIASVPPPLATKPELARVLTDEELAEKRRDDQRRLAEFEEQERGRAAS